MKKEDIQILVKALEPYFFGYTADDCTLTNELGLQLHFYSSWNNKTTISGLGGRKSHSIGCSFTKSHLKIANDIKKRLIPDYRDDYIKHKKEKTESDNFEAQELLKLEALAQSCSGELRDTNWNHRSPRNKYVYAENIEIQQNYSQSYEFKIDLNFSDSLKVIEFLQENKMIIKGT